MNLAVYTDGGSRGNPGISGFGVAIYNGDGQVIHKISKFIGIKTNNEAEYYAMIEALYWIKENKKTNDISKVDIYSDSQLLVRQILGKYQVKASHIKPLHQSIKLLLEEIDLSISFHEVLREKNKLADELANLAMDNKNET